MLLFILGFFFVSSLAKNISTIYDDVYYPGVAVGTFFDWQLFKEVSSESKNVLVSPLSLKLILALLYESSEGSTEREFQEVGLFTNKETAKNEAKQFLNSIQANERRDYLLDIGTRIFLNQNLTVQKNFVLNALQNYQTGIQSVNFSSPIEAAHEINSWVKKFTNGKISSIVEAENIENDDMIIGNTIYFKGAWKLPFRKEDTKTHGFYIYPNLTVSANYMTTTNQFYYTESVKLDAKILRLPYKGSEYSLFMVLPNSKAGLSKLLKELNLISLYPEISNLQPLLVEVSIPKFKFSFETNYAKILQNMGLKKMFENSASFPEILENNSSIYQNLIVSDIIQKTGIEVDEEGSVVYAASGVQIGNKFGEAELIFNASHPFLFFIQKEPDGPILFAGTVGNPLEAEGISKPLNNRLSDENKGIASSGE